MVSRIIYLLLLGPLFFNQPVQAYYEQYADNAKIDNDEASQSLADESKVVPEYQPDLENGAHVSPENWMDRLPIAPGESIKKGQDLKIRIVRISEIRNASEYIWVAGIGGAIMEEGRAHFGGDTAPIEVTFMPPKGEASKALLDSFSKQIQEAKDAELGIEVNALGRFNSQETEPKSFSYLGVFLVDQIYNTKQIESKKPMVQS